MDPSIDFRGFEREVADIERRVETLRQNQLLGRMVEVPGAAAFDELRKTFDELSVATEEMRQQNEHLHELQGAIDAERRRYREMFDFAPDPYLVTDRYGNIADINLAAERLLGRPREWMMGKPLAICIPAEDRRQFRHKMLELHEKGRIEWWQAKVRRGRSDQTIPALITAEMAHQPPGEQIRWLIRDISERRAMEVGASHIRARLEEQSKLATVGTLAASIVHDIRNPLNTILLSARLAQKHLHIAPADSQVRECLDMIVGAADRCNEITRNLLSFTRKDPQERTRTDLNEVLLQMADLVRTALHVPNVVLDLEPADDLPFILANPLEIERVLLNLVQNAAQAGEPARVRVTLATQFEGDTVRLIVRDDGPGIAPEHVPHIFEPFYTTRADAGGTGLGLSIVRRAVEQHYGRIRVESSVGAGTSFIMDFAVAAPSPEPG